MVGNLNIGENLRNSQIRFKNYDAFEAYNKSINDGYESEGSFFNGCIYKLNTPEFFLVNRSQ